MYILNTQKTKTPNFRDTRVWAPIFAVTLGVLYQTVYWDRFDIHALSYFGIQDIVRVSAIPLIITAITLLIIAPMVTYGEQLADGIERHSVKFAETLSQNKKRVFYTIVWATIAGVVGFLFWDSFHRMPKWHLTFMCIGVAIFAGIRHSSFLDTIESFYRNLILITICLGPSITIYFADTAAEKIENGSSYLNATIALEGFDSGSSPMPIKELKFLGHINGYDFFRKDKITYAVESQRIVHIATQRHRAH
jgi:hypothetical protein